MFVRDDWTLFRSLPTLAQRAGVPVEKVPAVVAKELTDNALDAAGSCRVGTLSNGGFFVEDDGAGIAGNAEDLARLFSIKRPLTSSKLLRRPTRGALGNGLRVVVGAARAAVKRFLRKHPDAHWTRTVRILSRRILRAG